MQAVETALRKMFGNAVGIGVTDPRAAPSDLWPTEAATLTRAIPKRRAEYAAGRRAARAAMVDLGRPAAAIPQGSDRAPLWPAGMTGSIAHCDTCCIAAVARIDDCTTLGIDVEQATALDADLIAIICTPTEQDWLASQPAPGLCAKMIFSAKEAVYKAQYPLTGQVIGFDAVTLTMTGDGCFTVTPNADLPALHGTICITQGLILSVCVPKEHTMPL